MIGYRALNTLNGLSYVGATTQDLDRRMQAHKDRSVRLNTPFALAIREYGWAAFRWEVIARCQTREELYERERSEILRLGTYLCGGYNCTIGGAGSVGLQVSPRSKAASSLSHRGRTKSDDERQSLRRAHRGRGWSEARRRAGAVAQKFQPTDYVAVKARFDAGETLAQIARDYGSRPSTLCQFLKRHARG